MKLEKLDGSKFGKFENQKVCKMNNILGGRNIAAKTYKKDSCGNFVFLHCDTKDSCTGVVKDANC